MHKEISEAVKLGVTLTAMSIVIMLILFTVDIGKGVEQQSYNIGQEILVELTNGQMESLLGEPSIVPVATAYSILNTNSAIIPKVVCNVCGRTTDLVVQQPCLIQHMRGKVNMTVKEYVGGGYEVQLDKVE